MKNISIIIPAHNEELYIGNCLQAIIAECDSYEGQTEIIVVDNQSTDKTKEIVAGFNVKLIKSSANSPAAVRNEGARQAKFDIFAFLDGDCIVLKGWLSQISEAYDDEKVGAFGGEHLAPLNDPWVVTAWNPVQLKKEYNVNAKLPGGNLTIKSSLFGQLKGFNENLVSAEDDYISEQVKLMGYLCVLDNEAAVIHQGYPKTLFNMFNKQVWHGSTQIKAHGYFSDKLLLVTYAYLVSIILFIYGGIVRDSSIVLIGFIGVVCCPILVLINRLKYHNKVLLSLLPAVFIISLFFISGRALGLLKELFTLTLNRKVKE